MTGATIFLGGPTASGKSALSVALAEAVDGVVINADSMQVYRELHILTARPGPAIEARVPHRLYGVLSAAETCSAARWRDLARTEIAAAHRRRKVPILVGGSGLYFRALGKGLASVPPIPETVRTTARARHRELGGAAFFAELLERDPEMAARLNSGDRQRLIRAWEVIEATGVSLAEWQRGQDGGEQLGGPVLTLVLVPPRTKLYRACDERFLRMMEDGALAEVEALLALDLDPAAPAMKALGVRPLRRFLEAEIGRDEAVVEAQKATRRYAKRQLTWFRHQMPEAVVLDAAYSADLAAAAISEARRFLLTVAGRETSLQSL